MTRVDIEIEKAADNHWAVTEPELRAAWEYAGPAVEHKSVDMTVSDAIDWLADRIVRGKDASKSGSLLRRRLQRQYSGKRGNARD